jgi:phosphomannomutase
MHRFHPTSLREYDIRGVIGQTLGEDDARAIGRSFGTLVKRGGGSRVAVGYDGRESSPGLEAALVEGLNAAGVDAVRIGLGATPMLYYAEAVLDVDGGIQITGSHNPPDYNGFKMVLRHGPFFGADIQALGRMAEAGDWESGTGGSERMEMEQRYVERLLQGFDGPALRVGWDAGNGAAGPALEKLAALLPGEHHLLFILAEPVLQDVPGGTIIADVKASQALYDRIAELGGKPLMWKTGHSHIKQKMKELNSPLAGEMSGHIFFAHDYFGFDDALYAAVRLIRAVGRLGRSLAELRDAMPKMVNTPEMRFQVNESRKFAAVDEVLERLEAQGANVNRTDGARVNTADGWWLLRASNTQDVLVARAEAKDEAGLERLVAQIDDQLARSGIERGPQAGH